MHKTDSLDQQALGAAKQYMGDFACPTVIFGLIVVVGYLATVGLAMLGQLPLWLAVPLVAVLTYLAYTLLHEAAHGSISGSQQSLRWLNEGLGYMAAWILMIPMTAHRHEHLAHHRHTNDEAGDPDFHLHHMRNSPLAAILSAGRIYLEQFNFYFEHRWHKAPARQNLYFCLEIVAAVLPRLALLFSGFWLESVWLLGVAWLGGLTITLYLFAYLVHRPHEDVGRYVDTSTILAPGPLHTVITWLWVFQNYHSIHHLFPRVPFYHYVRLYREIEPIMVAKGAPIYRLTSSGLVDCPPLARGAVA